MLFALRVFPTWAWTGLFLVEPTSQASRSSTQTAPSSSSSSNAGSAWMKENFQKPKTLHWRSVRHSCRGCSYILFNIFKDSFFSHSFLPSLEAVTLQKWENTSIWMFSARRCLNNLSPACPWIEAAFILTQFSCQSKCKALIFLLFTSVVLFSVHTKYLYWACALSALVMSLFLVAFVSVHISTNPWCHPRDCWGFPVSSSPASGRVSQGECRWLPCQPCCALEPRHRHRKSP